MTLIKQIQNDLVTTEKSLTDALLKTKVLANQINNDKLLKWVNGELNGFLEKDSIPVYRKTTGNLVGTTLNGNWQQTNVSIPTLQLHKEAAKLLKAVHVKDSVAALEEFTKTNGKVVMSVTAEQKFILQQSIIDVGNPYFQILNVHREISPSLFINILSAVRSKLLDFVLEIDNQFGSEVPIENLRSNPTKIINIMKTTIIGDGNVTTTGKNNKVEAKIKIKSESKKQLTEVLKANHVSQDQIIELLGVIDNEKPKTLNQFSGQVNGWILKMMEKAMDGSWQVGIGAAGALLADALHKYYGLI